MSVCACVCWVCLNRCWQASCTNNTYTDLCVRLLPPTHTHTHTLVYKLCTCTTPADPHAVTFDPGGCLNASPDWDVNFDPDSLRAWVNTLPGLGGRQDRKWHRACVVSSWLTNMVWCHSCSSFACLHNVKTVVSFIICSFMYFTMYLEHLFVLYSRPHQLGPRLDSIEIKSRPRLAELRPRRDQLFNTTTTANNNNYNNDSSNWFWNHDQS